MHVEGVLANNDYILNGCYIEITSNCNLRCIHCYNESGELRDQISVEAFKNVLGCYDNPKKASITLSGGEPLLHPQVWKFIDMMLESGILARNILLITNATCITDDVANMLAEKHVSVQVSLNGSRAELHDSICGKGNLDKSLEELDGYKQFEYVKEDLPHLLQYADFVISRAGANVIFELLALRKPTLLIPLSKKSSRGDQILNANSFAKEGYSLVLDEDEMMEKHNLLERLFELRSKKSELIKNMTNSEMKNGVDAILNVIMKSINKK